MPDLDRILVTKTEMRGLQAHSKDRSVTSGLPPYLIRQASKRLRIVSLILISILALGWVGGNLAEGELLVELTTPLDALPNIVILAASFAVLGLLRRPDLVPSTVITVGLFYEVVVSWCIPVSQYWGTFQGFQAFQLSPDLVGISSLALWLMFFTVIVPARPRYVLVALVLSGASMPVTMGILVSAGNAPTLPAPEFFSIFVLPYVFTVTLAYMAARIIYGMGRDVQRATELGSYRLLERIGRGGMGEVWKARHSFLARPAAVKLIDQDLLRGHEDPKLLLKRFEREAQVTASLDSPHTVALYDFGISDEGSFYYAMELLDGMDLETLVTKTGPLPPERVVHILRQACISLGEAHRRGLVHRDIKPANIFLCESAFELDFVKILDFGLVKRRASMGEGGATMTIEDDGIAGTPAYIAPELARGMNDVDGRADLYSLACVAYWMLTGRYVFEEDSAVEMIVAHIKTPPSAPSVIAEQVIPSDLDALILDCLAKDPADRPASAEEVAARLQTTGLIGLWNGARAARWWSAHTGVITPRAEFAGGTA